MERRLIDANALKENLSLRYMTELFPDWFEMPLEIREKIGLLGSTFKKAILNAPTIDAVEVVRCRECKHRGDPIACRMLVYDGKTQQLSDWTRDNGFCDFGVRGEPDGK